MELYPNKNISRAIYEDPQGRFWVSVSNEGVGQLNLQTGQITMLRDKHPQIDFHKRDFNFYPVSQDTFAVFGENGIYYYNTAKDQVYVPEIDDIFSRQGAVQFRHGGQAAQPGIKDANGSIIHIAVSRPFCSMYIPLYYMPRQDK